MAERVTLWLVSAVLPLVAAKVSTSPALTALLLKLARAVKVVPLPISLVLTQVLLSASVLMLSVKLTPALVGRTLTASLMV